MQLRCKKEARNDQGDKTMSFTKGRIYHFMKGSQGWDVVDDNGDFEWFVDPSAMFEGLNKKGQ